MPSSVKDSLSSEMLWWMTLSEPQKISTAAPSSPPKSSLTAIDPLIRFQPMSDPLPCTRIANAPESSLPPGVTTVMWLLSTRSFWVTSVPSADGAM